MALEQRVHRETVYSELLDRCPARTRDPLNGHSLAPKQLEQYPCSRGGYQVPARDGFLSGRDEAVEHRHPNSAVDAGALSPGKAAGAVTGRPG